MTLQVLLIESYYDGSHAAWADGYQASSRHDVRVITLPGRFWRWRLRGGAATVADQVADHVADRGRPDVVVVSSLLDVAQFAGLTRRTLRGVPIARYMHENQLAFPRSDATDVDAAVREWTSLLASDAVVFNSAFHRDVVVGALPELVHSMPDLESTLRVEEVAARSVVVPVGVDMLQPAPDTWDADGPPVVLWPHRWDADKQPDVFVRASQRLAADGVDHRVVLLGADAWDGDDRRQQAVRAMGERVLHAGHADRAGYLQWLQRADVVVSVAQHEFFGVAIVEAVAAGCVPVLPDRLSYPELIPARYHEAALYPEGQFRQRLASVVADLETARAATTGLADEMRRFSWAVVAPQLDEVVERLAEQASS